MATYTVVHDLLSGFPAAPSGVASFYLPSTTTPLVIYGDASGTATTNPVALDSNGAATVYLTQLARMIVQTVGGITISDNVINQEADALTANSSPAFTGLTQKSVNDAALAAFGGVDFGYVPSGAWVGMTPKAWMNGVVRNVMAYGSVGATTVNDGVTPADSAIAAAIADTQAAGGGVVFFPPGTFLVNSPIVVNTVGVVFRGAGAAASVIKINSGTNNGFTVTSANGTQFQGLLITATSATTGKSIAVATTTGLTVEGVKTAAAATGLSLTSVTGCYVGGNSNIQGSAHGIVCATCVSVTVVGGLPTSVEFDSASTDCVMIGCSIVPTFTGTTQPTRFYQFGNGADGSVISVATGATAAAIDLSFGNDVTITATGGVGTATVPDPVKLPPSTRRGFILTVRYVNAAGGAVTWAFSGTKFVHVGAAVPANTDLHTIIVNYVWDGTKFREMTGRADTLT